MPSALLALALISSVDRCAPPEQTAGGGLWTVLAPVLAESRMRVLFLAGSVLQPAPGELRLSLELCNGSDQVLKLVPPEEGVAIDFTIGSRTAVAQYRPSHARGAPSTTPAPVVFSPGERAFVKARTNVLLALTLGVDWHRMPRWSRPLLPGTYRGRVSVLILTQLSSGKYEPEVFQREDVEIRIGGRDP